MSSRSFEPRLIFAWLLLCLTGLPGPGWAESLRVVEGTNSLAAMSSAVELRLDTRRLFVESLRIDADRAGRYGVNLVGRVPRQHEQHRNLPWGGNAAWWTPSGPLPLAESAPPELAWRQSDSQLVLVLSGRSQRWRFVLRESAPGPALSWQSEALASPPPGAPLLSLIFPVALSQNRVSVCPEPAAWGSSPPLVGDPRGFLHAAVGPHTLHGSEARLFVASNAASGGDLGLHWEGEAALHFLPDAATALSVTASASAPATLHFTPLSQAEGGRRLVPKLADLNLTWAPSELYREMVNVGMAANPSREAPAFGNQTGGFSFALTAYTQAAILAAGQGGEELLAAFRRYLEGLSVSIDQEGRVQAGGLAGVSWENEASLLIAWHTLLDPAQNAADRELLRRLQPHLARAAGALKIACQSGERGLISYPAGQPDRNITYQRREHRVYVRGYWDALRHEGSPLFVNVLVNRALGCWAELETTTAAGFRTAQHEHWQRLLASFWREGLYARGGFVDHIYPDGEEVAVFSTAGPLLAVAWGLLDEGRARLVLGSLDARLAVLRREHGWCGWGVPSCLYDAKAWLLSGFTEESGLLPFGNYMNGGIFPEWTGWEILARRRIEAASGQADPAIRERLLAFAEAYRRQRCYEETNAWSLAGEPHTAIREPFLSTQAMLAAGVGQ